MDTIKQHATEWKMHLGKHLSANTHEMLTTFNDRMEVRGNVWQASEALDSLSGTLTALQCGLLFFRNYPRTSKRQLMI